MNPHKRSTLPLEYTIWNRKWFKTNEDGYISKPQTNNGHLYLSI